MSRNSSMRLRKPYEPCCQSKLRKSTWTRVEPICGAQPSSPSMVTGSNVSACHISSWLIAVPGVKLQPTIQRCCAYHSLALSVDHGDCASADAVVANKIPANSDMALILVCIFYFQIVP